MATRALDRRRPWNWRLAAGIAALVVLLAVTSIASAETGVTPSRYASAA
jgi:hypothetical protein